MCKCVQYAPEHLTTKLWRTSVLVPKATARHLYSYLARRLESKRDNARVLVFKPGKELKPMSVGPTSRTETSASTFLASNAIHVGREPLSIEDQKASTTLAVALILDSKASFKSHAFSIMVKMSRCSIRIISTSLH